MSLRITELDWKTYPHGRAVYWPAAPWSCHWWSVHHPVSATTDASNWFQII